MAPRWASRSALTATVLLMLITVAWAAPVSAGAATAAVSPDGLWTWSWPLPLGASTFTDRHAGARVLFAVTNSRPDILVTHDGGSTWSWSRTSSMSGFGDPVGVLFVSPQDGWVWGNGTSRQEAMLLHTSDGGATWQRQLDLPGWQFMGPPAVNFSDPSTGWAAVCNDDMFELYTTMNAGATWTLTSSPNDRSVSYLDLAPQGAGRALLAGDVWQGWAGEGADIGTRFWRTIDYGAHWTRLGTLMGVDIAKVVFSSARRGWAVDGSRWVRATADGGATWRRAREAPPGWSLQSITITGHHLWAVGPQGALRSVDGGRSWRALRGVAGSEVSFANPRDGWIAGHGSQYLHTSDAGVSWTRIVSAASANVSTLAAVPGGAVWGTGNGYVFRSPAAGEHWKRVTRPRGFTAVAAVSGEQAWAVGRDGRISHTSDAGRHWRRQMSGVGVTLRAACFVDESHGWAVGDKGTILRTTDGGRHWRQVSSGVSRSVSQVVFSDASHGLALTSPVWGKAAVLRSTDGGRTWSLASLRADAACPTALAFPDATHAYLVSGVVAPAHFWSSADGGQSWQQATDLPGTDVYAAIACADSDLCVVGQGGTVAISIDGGQSWSASVPANGLSTVQFVGTTVMIGGYWGVLTRDLTTASLP